MKIDYSNELLNSNSVSKKKNKTNKGLIVFWSVMGIIVFTAVILLGWFTYRFYNPKGYKNMEDLVADFIEATYDDNIDAIIDMMPYEFKTVLYDNAAMFISTSINDNDAISEQLHKELAHYHDVLSSWYGEQENWHLEYEIGSYYQYTNDEKQNVKTSLNQSGVDRKYSIDEYGLVCVSVHIKPNYGDKESMNHDIYVPVLKHGRSWYLAQYIGDYADEVESSVDMYGDLLDGFAINANLDEYGYEILYADDGTNVTWNPDYNSYTFTDMYGNICLCTTDFKITKIVGPDGGDRLTEETYEEWWHNYYVELYGEDYFEDDYDHDHDGYEEFIIDDDGNVEFYE